MPLVSVSSRDAKKFCYLLELHMIKEANLGKKAPNCVKTNMVYDLGLILYLWTAVPAGTVSISQSGPQVVLTRNTVRS